MVLEFAFVLISHDRCLERTFTSIHWIMAKEIMSTYWFFHVPYQQENTGQKKMVQQSTWGARGVIELNLQETQQSF